MTILVVTFSVQWFEVVVANAMTWPYETGWWTLQDLNLPATFLSLPIKQWWTDDESEMIHVSNFQPNFLFFLGGFIKLHYLITMATILIIVSVERTFACWYLNDYERKSRIWIAALIIFINQLFNFLVAVAFYFKFVHFVGMVLMTLLPNAVGLFLVLYTRIYNLKVTKTIENFSNPKNYTLAARYQAKENIRCFQMISNVLIAGIVFVSFGFTVSTLLYLKIFPNLDTILNILIQFIMSFAPVVICPTMIYSVDSWRKFAISKHFWVWKKLKKKMRMVEVEPPVRRKSTVKNELSRKETDVYFSQFNSAWK